MTTPRTIGFPRMMKEPAERRVFLPEFIQHLAQQGLTVCVEEGYGSRSGFTFDDYRQGNAQVFLCSHEEAYRQDLVIVLRSPTPEEFHLMQSGACLLSMLHFPNSSQTRRSVARAGHSGYLH